jgi:peptide-methionine (S)-S-oxide reductase
MLRQTTLSILTLFAAVFISCSTQKAMSYGKPAEIPAIPDGHEVITLGAGCFWCVETILQRVDGVTSVTSGYSNGKTLNPTYEDICRGDTNHAEVVRVVFDPKKIPLENIFDWFWLSHDPTTLNRQGNDIGTQYRSAIFFHTDEQKKKAEESMKKWNLKFQGKIVTEITKAETFYPAEVGHQDYYRINGNKNPYCRAVIAPKLEKLGIVEDKEKSK